MKIIMKWLVTALSLLLVARVVPGVEVESLYTALIAAVLLGFVNLIIRPIIILFTLPLTIVTLGLFTFVVNALLFWFIASFIDGFEVRGFGAAFLGALIVSAVSFVANRALYNDRVNQPNEIYENSRNS